MGDFLKRIVSKGRFSLGVFGLLAFLSCCMVINVRADNALIIKYLDNFPGKIQFNEKYKKVEEFLVYKYVNFSFRENININSAGLIFLVDNDWYKSNSVKDIIFLKFDNETWSRVEYNNKKLVGDNIKYQITDTSIGQYWAIIGVLPKSNVGEGVITHSIIEDKTIFRLVEDSGVVKNIVDVGKNIITTIKDPINVKGASVVATSVGMVSIMTLLALLNGPIGLLIIAQQIGSAFLGFFSLKKEHRRGIVYNIDTGIPVPLVRVDLVDKKNDKTKATRFTDKNGRYYFLVPEGEYYLKLKKRGYKTMEDSKIRSFKALLHKMDLKLNVELSEAGIIKKNVAILQKNSTSHGQTKIFLKRLLSYLINIVFFVGIVVSIWSCYINPNFFNFFILGIYVLILMFKSFFAKEPKYGIIMNNKRPEPFATISVLDAKTKKIISRVVSDTNGRYYVLLEKGKYILNIRTVEGEEFNRKMKVNGKNILSQKLIIQK